MNNLSEYLVMIIMSSLAASLMAAVDLPRYKFEPGLELVYSGSSDFNFGKGAFQNSGVTHYWVTGQNKDGSWHLIFTRQDKEVRTGDFASANDTAAFGSMDLFPDGRRADKPATISGSQSFSTFPPLPVDAHQLKSGWQFAENEAVRTFYRVKQTGPRWIFESTQHGIFHDIYQMSSSNTIDFDSEQGLVEKIQLRNEQGYGFTGHGTGVTQLKSHMIRGKDWIGRLVSEVDLVTKAEAAMNEAVNSVRSGDAKADAVESAARQRLQSALTAVQNSVLREKIKADLAGLDSRIRYAQGENQRADTVLNKPAATWATTDLDGQRHALEDYRGKIVVLDFWYRGCGWCMRAMPQIKALVEHFRGQPVVILGMNTDRQDKDARFVIDKLQLNYPTLHAAGIPEKYGVQGFPTFIVIDQKGLVRVRHVGYSPTLYQEMSKTISRMLADNK